MRDVPSATTTETASSNSNTVSVNDIYDNHVRLECDITTGLDDGWMLVNLELDSEL